MTKFNSKNDQGDWFKFFDSEINPVTGDIVYKDPEPDAAEFCIRRIQPFFEEQLSKRKKEHAMVLNPRTRQMERVSYFPDIPYEQTRQEYEDSIDYAITGIRGAFWQDGLTIACNRENKIKLSKMPMFDRFLGRVWSTLEGMEVKAREDAEKN